MRSVMKRDFSRDATINKPRSQFDRSHGYKTTFDSGYLVPVFADLAYPGDTFNLRMSAFGRLATPEFPFMDNMFLDSHFFAVPLRLLQDNFVKLMGEQLNPGDSISYLTPKVTAPVGTGFTAGSLYDYLGLPTEVPGIVVNNYFARAYQMTWNHWFRDPNMQNSIVVPTNDGPDTPGDFVLLRRGKRYDYFTACLTAPQRGNAVSLPLGVSADVWGSASANATTRVPNNAPVVSGFQPRAVTGATYKNQLNMTYPSGSSAATTLPPVPLGMTAQTGANGATSFDSNAIIFHDKASSVAFNASATAPWKADLTTATSATVNDIRYAVVIQQILEQDMRGGTRFPEIIYAHFGVSNPDSRMQYPEYLGGGSTSINVHPVTQTSATDAGTPQGNLAAFGTTSFSGHGFVKSFSEHCLVFGVVSVRADLNYQQGIERWMSNSTRYDFWWPEFAHLGEMAVLNKEIYAQGTANPTADEAVFGYIPRGDDLRTKKSLITGQFRSNYAQSLDAWHLAQDFTALPTLGPTFIVENPPVSRVIAVPTEPQFLFDSYFSFKCARPMPMNSIPGLLRF